VERIKPIVDGLGRVRGGETPPGGVLAGRIKNLPTPSERDTDSQRLDRSDHLLQGLCATTEHLHVLAALAQDQARMRGTDGKAIKGQVGQNGRKALRKQR
jgi:hypothetical protein